MGSKIKTENDFLKKELQVRDMLIKTLIHFIAENKIELPAKVTAVVEKLYLRKENNGN
jgi:hypothetical protein